MGSVYLYGSLLILTGLVYLTRNAILRRREIHADAVAAVHGRSGAAMHTVLGRLRQPSSRRWRAWLSYHPLPDQRLVLQG